MLPNDYTMRMLHKRRAYELHTLAAREQTARDFAASKAAAAVPVTQPWWRRRVVSPLWLRGLLRTRGRRLAAHLRPALHDRLP